MYENFGNFLLIIFTISKIDFTIKKPILGRKPGNRNFRKSQPVGLVIASETPWLRAAPFNVRNLAWTLYVIRLGLCT